MKPQIGRYGSDGIAWLERRRGLEDARAAMERREAAEEVEWCGIYLVAIILLVVTVVAIGHFMRGAK
jgi:hypothetical protein